MVAVQPVLGFSATLRCVDFKAILLEKGDLTHGTTGRYHGLLHSGGRYVVKDPQAAKECIVENRILRKIMPQCIEDTGGFFVVTLHDKPEYAEDFVFSCASAGIPVEEISIGQMLQEEPYLDPNIQRCFRVPDASADSFLAADLNAESARQNGAHILNYHRVVRLVQAHDQILGVVCQDLIEGDDVEIDADLVVNASGAWVGQIARMADLDVRVIPGKGTMVAINHRIVNTVINRCKLPSDGDILVPAHTVAVIGTTDVAVEDPDHFSIEPWEVHLMLQEGEKIIPGFSQMRMLRAWAGVRPLYQEAAVKDTRDVTRAFVLIDHQIRDGITGFITVTGGKWTTYRKMAEATVDLICEKFQVDRKCRTHLEPLPDFGSLRTGLVNCRDRNRNRLAEIEELKLCGRLICECELGTEEQVRRAILENSAQSIDDIRREVRVGMGPCQGGFCTYRVAGMLHQLRKTNVQKTNLALRDFLEERWKGLLPILWGQQLRQERLDQLIYLSILNADHLPGPEYGSISPVQYSEPKNDNPLPLSATAPVLPHIPNASISSQNFSTSTKTIDSPLLDVLVVGAGLSGLFTTFLLSQNGRRVRLISKGWGSLYWQTGCIDILGYEPNQINQSVVSPTEAITRLTTANPTHPYTRFSMDLFEAAIDSLNRCVCNMIIQCTALWKRIGFFQELLAHQDRPALHRRR